MTASKKMEDDLKKNKNGRQPKKNEDNQKKEVKNDLNKNGRRTNQPKST